MIGIWFTFGGQPQQLTHSVECWRETFGPDARVAFFDDYNNRLSQAVREQLQPDYYEQTKWPRRGNLNGWPCCDGIIAAFIKAMDELGGDIAAKIDCDTLIIDGSWIDPAAPMNGFNAGMGPYCMGFGYTLRREAAAAIAERWAGRFRDHTAKATEDWVITGEAMWAWGDRCNVIDWSEKRAGLWDPELPIERYDQCAAVTFQAPAGRSWRPHAEMVAFRELWSQRKRA